MVCLAELSGLSLPFKALNRDIFHHNLSNFDLIQMQ